MARPTKRGLTSEGGSMSERERENEGVGVGESVLARAHNDQAKQQMNF